LFSSFSFQLKLSANASIELVILSSPRRIRTYLIVNWD